MTLIARAGADSMSVTESYHDSVHSDGEGGTFVTSQASASFSGSVTVPGLSALSSDDWMSSSFKVLIGGFSLEGTLSDATTISSSLATFPYTDSDDNGNDVHVGSVTIKRSGNVLTVTAQFSNPSSVAPQSFFAGDFLGSAGAIAGSGSCEIQLGSFDVTRTVYFTGSNSFSTDNDGNDINNLHLSGSADFTAPTLAFKSPANATRLNTNFVHVVATAGDKNGVGDVQFKIGAEDFNSGTPPDTGNDWSADFELAAGPNTISAIAYDLDGNTSKVATLTVTYVVSGPITLQTNGPGSITGIRDGQVLEIGKTYTVTATPAAGYLFAGWTEGIISDNPKLTFAMQTGLVLQANFVPNPFVPAKGTYQGLFTEVDEVNRQSSGYFSQTLDNKGGFSAKIISGKTKVSFSGKYSGLGSYSNSIARKGQSPLIIVLQMDFGDNSLSGTIANSSWSAELAALRSGLHTATNPAPQAGKYTLILPGNDDSSVAPGGDGSGAVTIDIKGNLSFAGTLGDGTKVTQKTMICDNGQWALYLPLYSGQGSCLAWFTFASTPTQDISGNADWFKLAQARAALYSQGFTNRSIAAVGSTYTNKVPLLTLSSPEVIFSNGGLTSNITDVVQFVNNKVTKTGPPKLTFNVTAATGLFSGKATDPATAKTLSFSGALLQKQNVGRGAFLNPPQGGRVYFGDPF
jgi:hypothetical protein